MKKDLVDILQNVQEDQIPVKKTKDKDPDADDKDTQIIEFELAKVERYKVDTLERQWLAKWSAGLVSFWLYTVILILVFNRIILISDKVLIALLVTTTLNVLGLSFIVLNGLFDAKKVV